MEDEWKGKRGPWRTRRCSRMDLAGHVVVITGLLIAAFCLKDFEYIGCPTLSTRQDAKKACEQ